MNGYNNIKNIVYLIITEISEGLTPEQQERLDHWLKETPENVAIYNKIRNAENFRTWHKQRQNVNVQGAWEFVFNEIQLNERRIMFHRIIKYAAAILLPIIFAGGIYLYVSKHNGHSELFVERSIIKPGTSKAVLRLDNGQIVILDSINNQTVKEKDGTVIQHNNNILNYSSSSKSDDDLNEPIFNTITTPRGGEFNLVLADGTHVFLNSMSTLKYPVHFKGGTRNVELTGEAYFDVAHDTLNPFIVNTNQMQMKVLGTSFNINAYENSKEIVTTLVEGKLAVKTKDDNSFETILKPKEQAVFDLSTKQVSVNVVNVDYYTSWKNGKFVFYDTRLEDMMDVLTRWYSAQVFFMNPSVKELKFSGNLNKYGEIEQILDIIEATNKVNVEINNKSIVFSEK